MVAGLYGSLKIRFAPLPLSAPSAVFLGPVKLQVSGISGNESLWPRKLATGVAAMIIRTANSHVRLAALQVGLFGLFA